MYAYLCITYGNILLCNVLFLALYLEYLPISVPTSLPHFTGYLEFHCQHTLTYLLFINIWVDFRFILL